MLTELGCRAHPRPTRKEEWKEGRRREHAHVIQVCKYICADGTDERLYAPALSLSLALFLSLPLVYIVRRAHADVGV